MLIILFWKSRLNELPLSQFLAIFGLPEKRLVCRSIEVVQIDFIMKLLLLLQVKAFVELTWLVVCEKHAASFEYLYRLDGILGLADELASSLAFEVANAVDLTFGQALVPPPLLRFLLLEAADAVLQMRCVGCLS